MSLHIHAPAGVTVRMVRRCRRCRVRRRLVVTFYEWYGPEVTCCHCGAHTSDGWLRPARARDARAAAEAAALWPTLPSTQRARCAEPIARSYADEHNETHGGER